MQNETNLPNSGSNSRGLETRMPVADSVKSGVKGEMRNFAADIEDLITSTTSLTAEDLTRAKEKISARAAALKTSVEQMGGAVAERARSTAKATDTYVHERPWQSIGIVAAVGLLIGYALAGRRG